MPQSNRHVLWYSENSRGTPNFCTWSWRKNHAIKVGKTADVEHLWELNIWVLKVVAKWMQMLFMCNFDQVCMVSVLPFFLMRTQGFKTFGFPTRFLVKIRQCLGLCPPENKLCNLQNCLWRTCLRFYMIEQFAPCNFASFGVPSCWCKI